jgi:voltage-gated potassium channel
MSLPRAVLQLVEAFQPAPQVVATRPTLCYTTPIPEQGDFFDGGTMSQTNFPATILRLALSTRTARSTSAVRQMRRGWRDLRRNRFLNIFAIAMALAIVAGYLVYEFEAAGDNSSYSSYWDGVWWAVVTMTTVGYGDKFPVTIPGRVVGMFLMVGGVAALSVMTANVASALVSESLREARGLEPIHWRGHVLLCGWNQQAEEMVQNLIREMGERMPQLVLVNQLPEENVNNILYKLRDIEVRYVRGSHTDEAVLQRANVSQASAAVVLADATGGDTEADEATLLAVLAIKQLNSSLRVTAEVLDGRNGVHLRRANADEVIVSGEYNPFLLAASVASPGLPQAARLLLGTLAGTQIRRMDVPTNLIGHTFGELAAQLRKDSGALVVGLITDIKGLTLDEMIGSDTSFIDEFIRRKFTEAGMDKRVWDAGGISVALNPPDQQQVGPNDVAVVLGRRGEA